MEINEKIQSQFGNDAKVKGAALMVSANPSSEETKQRRGGNLFFPSFSSLSDPEALLK
jgi:hypothetical protein